MLGKVIITVGKSILSKCSRGSKTLATSSLLKVSPNANHEITWAVQGELSKLSWTGIKNLYQQSARIHIGDVIPTGSVGAVIINPRKPRIYMASRAVCDINNRLSLKNLKHNTTLRFRKVTPYEVKEHFLHELGHFRNHYSGKEIISNLRGFRNAYALDVRAMPLATRSQLNYFTNPSRKGLSRDEAFAEIYKHLATFRDDPTHSSSHFYQFPQVTTFIYKIFQSELGHQLPSLIPPLRPVRNGWGQLI
ncbi:MAG: hypothetical protein VKK59_03000 [Vampirovibrionales bacterium]|nr:hypothetical protein [Vampirovibrionales bacterium]